MVDLFFIRRDGSEFPFGFEFTLSESFQSGPLLVSEEGCDFFSFPLARNTSDQIEARGPCGRIAPWSKDAEVVCGMTFAVEEA